MTNGIDVDGLKRAFGQLNDFGAPSARNATLEAEALSNRIRTALDVQKDLAQLGLPRSIVFTIGDGFFEVTLPDTSDTGRESWLFELARQMTSASSTFRYEAVPSESLTGEAEATPSLVDIGFKSLGFGFGDNRGEDLSTAQALRTINAPSAWARDVTGRFVRIGVIDTGWSDHPETRGCYDFASQRNFVGDDDGVDDAADRFSQDVLRPSQGHGTLVASVCASRGGVYESDTQPPGTVTGSAPEATVVPIRAIRSVVDLRQTRIAAAIRYAITDGPEGGRCDVLAMALGGLVKHRSVELALRRASEAGVVSICAAGNIWPWTVYPARFAENNLCCAVAAVTPNGAPWRGTSKGSSVTVSAPGAAVWGSFVPNGAIPREPIHGRPDILNRWSQGTTLSTALTAGLAGLWMQRHGGREALRERAQDLGTTVQSFFNAAVTHDLPHPQTWAASERKMGAGIVDAEKLLDAPLQLTSHSPEVFKSLSVKDPVEQKPKKGPPDDLYTAERDWRRSQEALRNVLSEQGVELKQMPPPSPSLAAADRFE